MRKILYCIMLLMLGGCATPYQQIGTTVAGGYSSTRISEAAFDVRFDGNGFTDPKRAYDFAFLRAAEIALEHDYPYFVLIGHLDDASVEIIQGNSTSYTTGTVSTYGNYGTYSSTTSTYNNDIPITKPSLKLRIYCLERPDGLGKHAGKVYVAREVKDEFRKKYGLD